MDAFFQFPFILGGHAGARLPMGFYSDHWHLEYGGQLGYRFAEKLEVLSRFSVGSYNDDLDGTVGFVEISLRVAKVF